jgi:hypothetical protein
MMVLQLHPTRQSIVLTSGDPTFPQEHVAATDRSPAIFLHMNRIIARVLKLNDSLLTRSTFPFPKLSAYPRNGANFECDWYNCLAASGT